MMSRCATSVALLATICPPAVSWTTVPGAFPSGSTKQRHVPASSFGAATRSRGGVRMVGMGAAEDDIVEEVRALRASQIKKTLEEMSVSTEGVYEKEGLVEMLVAEKIRTLGESQAKQPTSQTPSTHSATTVPMPTPETWTEAKFGDGGADGTKAARLTREGFVITPMIRMRPSQSVLGDAISVDQKDYYCIEVDLPDAPRGPTTELFMLDTAATSSLLTPRAYERLGAEKTGVMAMGSAGTDGMSGLFQVSLGKVNVAGQHLGELKPVVMELPITDVKGKGSEAMEKGVSGILGMDFLARFDVKLDFQTGDATFAKFGTAAAGGLGSSEMTGFPCSILPTGFMVIDVKMKSTEKGSGTPCGIPAIVDLGSAFTIANWAAGRLAGLEPHGPYVRYNGQVVAGAAAPGEVYRPVEVGESNMDLLIGGKKGLGKSNSNLIRSRVVMFADLPGFKAMGMNEPTIILGSDVLKLGKGAMIFSYGGRKIWLAL